MITYSAALVIDQPFCRNFSASNPPARFFTAVAGVNLFDKLTVFSLLLIIQVLDLQEFALEV